MTATLTRQTLSPIIDAALAAFPVGERAVKAAEYVLAGRVQRAANVNGQDRWHAKGSAGKTYQLSIAGGWCQCPDAQYQAPRGPKDEMLCKHMLASMYLVKVGVNRPPTAPELAARIFDGAENEVRLYVREKWTGTMGKTQTDVLRGYRVDGGERVELAEPVDMSPGNIEFWDAVEAAGWQFGHKTANGDGLHCWWMEPAPVPVEDWPQEHETTNDTSLEGLWE